MNRWGLCLCAWVCVIFNSAHPGSVFCTFKIVLVFHVKVFIFRAISLELGFWKSMHLGTFCVEKLSSWSLRCPQRRYFISQFKKMLLFVWIFTMCECKGNFVVEKHHEAKNPENVFYSFHGWQNPGHHFVCCVLQPTVFFGFIFTWNKPTYDLICRKEWLYLLKIGDMTKSLLFKENMWHFRAV